MQIRRAVADDLDALVELNRAFCEADRHPFDATRARAGFAPLLVDDRHGVVWITDDPDGYAVVTWGWSIEAGGPEGILDEIYVSVPGAGHGSALLDHALVDAAAVGLHRLFLETERHNDRARRLYARHGFVEESSIWMTRPLRPYATEKSTNGA